MTRFNSFSSLQSANRFSYTPASATHSQFEAGNSNRDTGLQDEVCSDTAQPSDTAQVSDKFKGDNLSPSTNLKRRASALGVDDWQTTKTTRLQDETVSESSQPKLSLDYNFTFSHGFGLYRLHEYRYITAHDVANMSQERKILLSNSRFSNYIIRGEITMDDLAKLTDKQLEAALKLFDDASFLFRLKNPF